jgi:hypothetical protein
MYNFGKVLLVVFSYMLECCWVIIKNNLPSSSYDLTWYRQNAVHTIC